jgi:hypothetical protein
MVMHYYEPCGKFITVLSFLKTKSHSQSRSFKDMKFLALVSVLALAGCAASPPRSITVNDLYESKLAEVRAENAKLHNDLAKFENDPCFKSVAGVYDHVITWAKQEYADHTK